MAQDRIDVLMHSPMMSLISEELDKTFTLHRLWKAPDPEALIAELAPQLRAIAAGGARVDRDVMRRFPKLEIVAGFGVGYEHIDAQWAGEHGIVVTNTPDVLTEEVADTALGLLLCTVRRLPQADRHVREGKWLQRNFPLTPTLRGRTIGIVGLGRIGKAVARRLDAFGVPVLYHNRRRVDDAPYRYVDDLVALARAVDTLIVVTPGGADTRNLIDARVLAALGSDGILINVGRGTVVDEAALIHALQNNIILGAGLDVFADEPHVPAALLAMDQVVLLPHVGSATQHTRHAMGRLVVDNLLSWAAGRGPLTPVAEAPWPPRVSRQEEG